MGVFNSLRELKTLDLSSNKIEVLPSTLFDSQHLVTLDLSNNELSSSPTELFIIQNKLISLNLCCNNLTINASVAKNFITVLNSHVFFSLDVLEFINASYNAIQRIGSKVVSDETKLKTFDLRGNEMYKVISHSFTSLTIP